MEWKKADQPEDGRVSIPENWLFLHYYEALSVLFRIENALRIFVYTVLRRHHGRKWHDLSLESDDQSQTTIRALAKRRIAQAEACGYLGFRVHSPLLYLTSGELLRLILADNYWPQFKRYFPADKGVVTLKLQEIGLVRNALAHFRPVSAEDVAVVQQNARQILSTVEEAISDVFNCDQQIPSNSQDAWFTKLAQLSRDRVKVSANQSASREWIRLSVLYQSPIISKPAELTKYFMRISVVSPNAIKVLDMLEPIRDSIVFASEDVQAGVPSLEKLYFRKALRYTIYRDHVIQGQDEIVTALDSLAQALSEDDELLCANPVAEGRLAKVLQLGMPHREYGERSYWVVEAESAKTPLSPNAIEFVGSSSLDRQHALSDTTTFPWMPVAVSSEWPPF